MITIEEVIEQCAQECEGEAVDWLATGESVDEAYNTALLHAARAIRALKQQYEGCIVAEGDPAAHQVSHYDRTLRLCAQDDVAEKAADGFRRGTDFPESITVTPLYRARETK